MQTLDECQVSTSASSDGEPYASNHGETSRPRNDQPEAISHGSYDKRSTNIPQPYASNHGETWRPRNDRSRSEAISHGSYDERSTGIPLRYVSNHGETSRPRNDRSEAISHGS